MKAGEGVLKPRYMFAGWLVTGVACVQAMEHGIFWAGIALGVVAIAFFFLAIYSSQTKDRDAS
ncbi:MAG TPA: hypothetical protein VE975_03575 [Actinomycetota bacterium]|jgi:hypothetical protein|nr:hypothetical protein [Actinomycetota bacterium]